MFKKKEQTKLDVMLKLAKDKSNDSKLFEMARKLSKEERDSILLQCTRYCATTEGLSKIINNFIPFIVLIITIFAAESISKDNKILFTIDFAYRVFLTWATARCIITIYKTSTNVGYYETVKFAIEREEAKMLSNDETMKYIVEYLNGKTANNSSKVKTTKKGNARKSSKKDA